MNIKKSVFIKECHDGRIVIIKKKSALVFIVVFFFIFIYSLIINRLFNPSAASILNASAWVYFLVFLFKVEKLYISKTKAIKLIEYMGIRISKKEYDSKRLEAGKGVKIASSSKNIVYLLFLLTILI